jgi:hypothetical protein
VASIATHRRPPLGGPGNTQRVYCGRSSGLRTFSFALNSYLPSLPDRLSINAFDQCFNDGFRFRLPLRGSPRFSLGSLLSAFRAPATGGSI